MSSINAKNINKLKLLKCLDALFHPLGHSLLFVFISLAYNFILRKGSQISHISHGDEKSSTTMDGHESQERYEMAQSDDGISKLFTWPSWNETRRTWKIVFRSRHHRVTEKFHFSPVLHFNSPSHFNFTKLFVCLIYFVTFQFLLFVTCSRRALMMMPSSEESMSKIVKF